MAPTAKPPAVVPAERRTPDDHEQHHADDGDGGVLAIEIGLGAGLDGRGDFLHAGIARRAA